MLDRYRADQFHNDDRLAYASAAKDTGFTAFGEGCDQVNNLDASFEYFYARRLFGEIRGWPVNRVFCFGIHRAFGVYRLPQDVKDTTQGFFSHRHHNRRAGAIGRASPLQAIGSIHRDCPHPIIAQMFLNF